MNWLTLASITTIVFQVTNLWLISKGVIAYPIWLIVYLGYMFVETYIALAQPAQWSVMLFNLVNAWAILMVFKGVREHSKWIVKAEKKEAP